MTRPANLEFAGGSGPLPDAVIQQKLRHAPRWVHVDVDRRREQRGLPPLFAVRGGRGLAVAGPRRAGEAEGRAHTDDSLRARTLLADRSR
jgi:hypothetical protein